MHFQPNNHHQADFSGVGKRGWKSCTAKRYVGTSKLRVANIDEACNPGKYIDGS